MLSLSRRIFLPHSTKHTPICAWTERPCGCCACPPMCMSFESYMPLYIIQSFVYPLTLLCPWPVQVPPPRAAEPLYQALHEVMTADPDDIYGFHNDENRYMYVDTPRLFS